METYKRLLFIINPNAGIKRKENRLSEIVIMFSDYGYETMIYGNGKSFMLMMDITQIDDIDKWFADYVATDDYTPYFPYDFSIWQFSSQGYMQGITGDVDLNIRFNK